MNARETAKIRELKIRELTSTELDAVSGGRSVLNTSALSLPKPPYPPIAK